MIKGGMKELLENEKFISEKIDMEVFGTWDHLMLIL